MRRRLMFNLLPKPYYSPRTEPKRLPEGKRMTVAIGSKCIGGVILYADRNVIGTDGSKTQACKIYSRNTRDGAIALASATDDAAASEALAQQILDDLSKTKFQNVSKLISQLRKNLIEWSAPYPKDLTMQYLMAVALDGET